jgi:CheY-like chemotaxis protein
MACEGPILLVEDDADIRESLKGVLEDEGFSVQEASNGREALDVLLRTAIPCVILLDRMMPIMDGRQFLDELRKTSAAGVRVIVLPATEPGKVLSGAIPPKSLDVPFQWSLQGA